MDIQAKKIRFVQEFFWLKNEALIDKFEKLFQFEKMKSHESEFSPMTMDQLDFIIDNAEDDSINGRMTSATKIRNEFGLWT